MGRFRNRAVHAQGAKPVLPAGLVHRLAISDTHRPVLEESFRVLCRLHDEGRVAGS